METINTFDKGMIKDTHPLTTPNNVLTDALNATYITYNGNEMILQNDLGNAKVKHAKLPEGYVPIGMKEHGGIIYVAAYDPENNKGQVGCFPSPQQLWEGKDWSVNAPDVIDGNVSINSNVFYDGCIIKNESVKILLFTCANDKPPRKLYPGDKFAIQLQGGDLIASADAGKIVLQLGVVKKDGSIEVMYDYKDHQFLCNTDPNDIVTTNSAQVFTASSSGNLVLIVTLVTLDSFNIFRKYSLDETNNKISVTFKGSGTRNGEIIPCDGVKLGIATDSCNMYEEITDEEEANKKITLTLYPALPYGKIDRMKRSFTIDYNKIRRGESTFHEWRFFVTENYIKIGWAYEYYNLNEDKNIDQILMKFYDLWDSNPEDAKTGSNPTDTLYIKKDYYSGNFEDYLRFDAHPGIKHKHIYIVRIEKEIKGQPSLIGWQMLYVSPLYNSQYNGLYDEYDPEQDINTPIVQFRKLAVDNATLDFTQDIQYELKNKTAKIFIPGKHANNNQDYASTSSIDLANVNKNSYIVQNPSINYDPDDPNNQFVTELCNEYEATITINGTINYNNNVIGCPDPNLINNVLNEYAANIQSDLVCEANKTLEWKSYGSTSGLGTNHIEENKFVIDKTQISAVVKDNSLTISKIKIYDYRYIQGRSSSSKATSYETEGLAPLYSNKLSNEDRKRVFTACNQEEPYVISGRGKGSFKYNSIFNESGNINPEGPDTGSGHDDSGLDDALRLMNETSKPMVSIFVSSDNRYSLYYCPMLLGTNPTNYTRWANVYTQPYMSDNWMIAVWKFTDGRGKFVNLASIGDFDNKEFNYLDRNSSEVRLDIKLRCFLSQIFVPQKMTLSTSYITTNGNYRYQEGDTGINLKLTANNNFVNITFADIMYEDKNTPIKKISTLLQEWGIENNHIFNGNITYQANFNNLVPELNIVDTPEVVKTFPITINNDFEPDRVLNYYLGVSMTGTVAPSSSIDIQKWYVVNTASINNPNIQYDGTIEWDTTPDVIMCDNLGTGSNKTILFDWTGAKHWEFADLGKQFTTTAALQQWSSIQEKNELLANYLHKDTGKISQHLSNGNYIGESSDTDPNNIRGQNGLDSIHGVWYELDNKGDHGPDLYFNILLSNKSYTNGTRHLIAKGEDAGTYTDHYTQNGAGITFSV